MKVLVIFSDPPSESRPRLRLDREDKGFLALSKRFSQSVSIERLHASAIDDIHDVICDNTFDVIQFSGHGSGGLSR